MKRFTALVFDETIHTTTPVYTSNAHNDVLGSADKLCIQAVVDEVANITSPTLTVAIEHSADGRFWIQKNTPPEIDAASTPTGGTTPLVGSDQGGVPSLCLVRLRLTLGGTGGTPAAHVRVHVTGRDT